MFVFERFAAAVCFRWNITNWTRNHIHIPPQQHNTKFCRRDFLSLSSINPKSGFHFVKYCFSFPSRVWSHISNTWEKHVVQCLRSPKVTEYKSASSFFYFPPFKTIKPDYFTANFSIHPSLFSSCGFQSFLYYFVAVCVLNPSITYLRSFFYRKK